MSGRGRGGGGGRGGRGAGGGAFRSDSFKQSGNVPPGGRGGGERGRGRGRGGFGGGRGRGGPPAPLFNPGPVEKDRTISTAGDALVSRLSKLSIKREFPARPGYGTRGSETWVRANFFGVDIPSSTLFLYRVAIEPSRGLREREKRRALYDALERSEGFRPHAATSATDYGDYLVCAQKLNPEASDAAQGQAQDKNVFTVQYVGEGEGEEPAPAPAKAQGGRGGGKGKGKGGQPARTAKAPAKPGEEYTFNIDRVAEIDLKVLRDYYEGRKPDANIADMNYTFQALNIMVSKYPRQNAGLVAAGRDKYFPIVDDSSLRTFLSIRGLVVRKGFYSSIRPTLGRVLLNVNVCTAVFYEAEKLPDLMAKYTDRPLGRQWDWNANPALQKFLQGVKVTHHYMGSRRTKTISGIDNYTPATRTFECPDPETGAIKKFNVEQYFLKRYGLKLRHPELPCIIVGMQTKQHIPAELLTVKQGQLYKETLLPQDIANVQRLACKMPTENARAITETGLRYLGVTGGNEHLRKLGMNVSSKMMEMPARVLPNPVLQYQNTQIDRSASWNLQHCKFATAAAMTTWTFMIVEDSYRQLPRGEDNRKFDETINNFQSACKKAGMHVSECSRDLGAVIQLNGKRGFDYVLDELKKKAFEPMLSKNKRLDAVLVILALDGSLPNKPVYAAIKKAGDMLYGVRTVCSHWSEISKTVGQPMYLANLSLKFNLKLGGVNHLLRSSDLGPTLRTGKVMLVGCDVTHASPGGFKTAPSIAGVVASIDKNYCQYPASLRLQPPSAHEMIAKLDEMMKERLLLWADHNNGAYPERIIIYRDGVSEGEFPQVLSEELPQVRKAVFPGNLRGAPRNYKPKITVVVVGKRHHTRFYPTDQQYADERTGNCKAGHVYDRGVTSIYDFDFYLQAHQSIIGTARPAHYYVLTDENGFDADSLQVLTHNLCYQFGRATKSVSYCPPAYYADLACERGRCYIYKLLNASETKSESTSAAGQGKLKAKEKRSMKEEKEEEARRNFEHAEKQWGEGVHANVKNSMFYV